MQIHELPSGTPTDSDLLPFDTGTANYKTPFSGFDVGENSATFTSADEADPSQFKTVSLVETGPIKTILNGCEQCAVHLEGYRSDRNGDNGNHAYRSDQRTERQVGCDDCDIHMERQGFLFPSTGKHRHHELPIRHIIL